MLSKLASLRDREDGFTLIELLIVVIIIGILAAIALPIFLNQQKAAKDANVQSDVRNTVDNVATYQAQNPTATDPTLATKVVSGGDTVTIAGTYANGYTVSGSNSGGSKYVGGPGANYVYNSATGSFGLG